MPNTRTALFRVCTAALLAAGCGSNSSTKPCTADSDCDSQQSCQDGKCVTFDAGPPQPLGGACYESLQCDTGLACVLDGNGLPDGMCTEACDDTNCPAGTACADLRATPVNAKVCLPIPTPATPCRDGYAACAGFSGACLPPELCPGTELQAPSDDLGAACTAGSCSAGEICRFGLDFPGGACTAPCVVGDASSCPQNGTCTATDQGPLCLLTCTDGAATCRSGYSCTTMGASGSVCSSGAQGTRACTNAPTQILSGGTAGPSAAPAFCVQPVGPSSLPGPLVQEFGAHTVGDVVHFSVPAQAASVSIVSQAIHARTEISYMGNTLDNTVVPTQITTPNGTVIYDDGTESQTNIDTETVYYGAVSPATSVLTLPNTTAGLAFADGGLPGGTWSFTVNDYAIECAGTSGCDGGSSDGLYDVSVVVKPGPALSTGTIDVAFYLVDANGLTSASAPANPSVQRMVSTLKSLYASAGICIGSVTFFDVPVWAQNLYKTGLSSDKDGPCDELNQMFTLSRAGNTLNFFLVGDISATNAGGTVVGVDGTIPGPSTLGGTIHSGAAVSAADLSQGSCGGAIDLVHCGADVVGYIAAHEGGHWMGLYHTSESNGALFDPITDTPICNCALCTGSRSASCSVGSNPTFVEATDCNDTGTSSCGGAGDLMFWLLDQSLSKGTLTAQQAEVMRHNLLVQ